MRTEEDYELIDKYLSGYLSGADLQKFNQRIKNDVEFDLAVKRQQLSNQLLIEQRLINAKDFVKNYTAESGKNNLKKWFAGIFAGLLVLATVGYIYLNEDKKVDTETKVDHFSKDSTSIVKTESKNASKFPDAKPIDESPKISSGSVTMAKEVSPVLPEDIKFIKPLVDSSHKLKTPVQLASEMLKQDQLVKEEVPCMGNKIKASINTFPTCKAEETGIIDIRNITGGTSPYVVSIDGGKSYQAKNSFGFLENGTYSVILKDKLSCISETLFAKIEIKNCDKPKDNIFNPSQGEVWNFPVDGKKVVKISIMNREGKLVYLATGLESHQESWDGKDMSHNYSEVGIHYYVIEFEDGSVRDGYVTIVM